MDRANTGTATPSSMALPDPADACLAAPFGMPVELLPNLYLVRVPLPHNPLRALNSYLILSKDRTTIVASSCTCAQSMPITSRRRRSARRSPPWDAPGTAWRSC